MMRNRVDPSTHSRYDFVTIYEIVPETHPNRRKEEWAQPMKVNDG